MVVYFTSQGSVETELVAVTFFPSCEGMDPSAYGWIDGYKFAADTDHATIYVPSWWRVHQVAKEAVKQGILIAEECRSCEIVRRVLETAGKHWSYRGDIIYLRGEPFAYFRHVDDEVHEAGVVGVPDEIGDPDWNEFTMREMSDFLSRMAYG